MDPNVAAGLVRSANRPKAEAPSQAPNPLRGIIPTGQAPLGSEVAAKEAADLKQAERMKLAKMGHALPDGSFPIRNADELHKAMDRAHQGNNEGAAKALIRKRAKELGVKLPVGY